ncbi:OCIA domain-containing protein 2 isoform X1 [Salvelinus namaycush]|uniref:OCIA domain-containing protein 2 isoform X1 n=1 Tax=Salvelinus namaycush TaxID=8040 RepID=A0A8U1BYX2_SALNM|nr:OCIA domain-containing protein 2 isoform X1 [Salvelinus namaycush]
MSSETLEKTLTVKAEGATPWEKCQHGDRHIHRDDVRQIWKECKEESFWYRALPLSLGSMAVTGGLIYKGVWSASKTLGPFPKLAVLMGLLDSVAAPYSVRLASLVMQWGRLPMFQPAEISSRDLGPSLVQNQNMVLDPAHLEAVVLAQDTDTATTCVKSVSDSKPLLHQ